MKDKFFVGQREATIDVKRRMSISSPFMDVLRSINQNHLYLNKYSETLSDTTYPILGLKTSLYCPEEMFFRGEEKIKRPETTPSPRPRGRLFCASLPVPEIHFRQM